jgi:hypothetical protein
LVERRGNMTPSERMAEMEIEELHAEILEMGQTADLIGQMVEDQDELWEQHEAALEAERLAAEAELQEQLQMMELEDRL